MLELRTSRESLDVASVAQTIFRALPQRKKNKLALFPKPITVSCEISSLLQSTRFTISCKKKDESYVQSLISSVYKNSIIDLAEYDPVSTLCAWQSESSIPFVITEIKPDFINPSAKIKSCDLFTDDDSLAPLLSYFAKLDQDVGVVFQAVVRPLFGWKSVLSDLLSYNVDSPDPNAKQSANDNRALSVSLRFGIWTPEKDKTQNVIDSLSAVVFNWSAELSHPLQLTKPVFQKRAARHFINRNLGSYWTVEPSQAATLFHLPHKQLATIHNIHWGKLLPGEPPENLPLVSKDMDSVLRQELNIIGKTLFKNQERVFAIKRPDRRRHIYVIGKTGTGKSTLLANMAINDLKNDEGICVIDPHGDLVETLLDFIPARRINDVIYFDPADTGKTVKINLFEGENLVHRELIASGIVSVFYKLYGYSWGPRLEYILRNALLTLLTAQSARLSDITRLLTDKKFRDKITENLEDPVLASFWKNEFDNLQDRLRNEAIAPILNKVGQFVSSPMIRNVVDAHKSSFSLEQAMNEGKIILVNLSQGKLGEDNATLIGAMLITKIQLAAMSRVYQEEETRKDFFLYVDEFQNFATQSFIKILSEARKYRLNLTLANQYIAQIPEEVQKAIFGNCGSMISFVMGAEDAALFSKEFNSMYSEIDLVSLSKHQVITKLTIDNVISHPFPAYTLPLAASSNQNRPKVLKVSKERYAA